MTAKEFLSQARYLDRLIKEETRRMETLRHTACSISGPNFGERVQTSRTTDAPFVKAVNEAVDTEAAIKNRIAQLLCLKVQINEAIDSLKKSEERIVVYYRYVENKTWEEISQTFQVDRTTVYRWHNRALEKIILPENPIIL